MTFFGAANRFAFVVYDPRTGREAPWTAKRVRSRWWLELADLVNELVLRMNEIVRAAQVARSAPRSNEMVASRS